MQNWLWEQLPLRIQLFNQPLHQLEIDQASIDAVLELEQKELIRSERQYRGNRVVPVLEGKTVILVDDGIATEATMQAEVASLGKLKPASIIIAVPVAARETCEEMKNIVDQLICLLQPLNFYSVGLWYENFPQVSDKEVIELSAPEHI